MRRILGGLILTALVIGCASGPRSSAPRPKGTPEAHRAAAEELMSATRMTELTDSISKQIVDMQLRSNPGMVMFQDIMVDFLERHLSWEKIKDEIIESYVEVFTEAELLELTAFYRTPLGEKTLEQMPELMQRGMEIAQAKLTVHLPELQRLIMERIEAANEEGDDEE